MADGIAEICCVDVVERITDYLDDALAPAERVVIEAHLGHCDGCHAALAQFRLTIEAEGRLSEADVVGLDDATRDDLIAAFRASRPT